MINGASEFRVKTFSASRRSVIKEIFLKLIKDHQDAPPKDNGARTNQLVERQTVDPGNVAASLLADLAKHVGGSFTSGQTNRAQHRFFQCCIEVIALPL